MLQNDSDDISTAILDLLLGQHKDKKNFPSIPRLFGIALGTVLTSLLIVFATPLLLFSTVAGGFVALPTVVLGILTYGSLDPIRIRLFQLMENIRNLQSEFRLTPRSRFCQESFDSEEMSTVTMHVPRGDPGSPYVKGRRKRKMKTNPYHLSSTSSPLTGSMNTTSPFPPDITQEIFINKVADSEISIKVENSDKSVPVEHENNSIKVQDIKYSATEIGDENTSAQMSDELDYLMDLETKTPTADRKEITLANLAKYSIPRSPVSQGLSKKAIACREMYDVLLEPFHEQLENIALGQEILIVTEDVLSLLPFSAMVRK